MKNFVQLGDNLDLIAPRALNSGDGFLVGSIFGVSSTTVAQGSVAESVTRGVFDLPKAAGAVTQGQLIYWDDVNHVVTTNANAGANKLIGAATQVAANGDATARVKLNGQVS